MQVVSSWTMKPAEPMPLPIACEPLVADRDVELVAAVMTALATPENTALTDRPRAARCRRRR
jgi:hypothetical protein